MKDSIELSPKTIEGLEHALKQDFNAFELPERMAFVVLRLKRLPDDDKSFPRGKWATIQEIERQLEDCVKFLEEEGK
jgi:hypothetical protein